MLEQVSFFLTLQIWHLSPVGMHTVPDVGKSEQDAKLFEVSRSIVLTFCADATELHVSPLWTLYVLPHVAGVCVGSETVGVVL
jgi:hypothetical protein